MTVTQNKGECTGLLFILHVFGSLVVHILSILSANQLLREERIPPNDFLITQLVLAGISLGSFFFAMLGLSNLS